MGLLPLNLTLPMMQTQWASILNPLLGAQSTNQIVIGTPQTAFTTTTSTTYVTLAHSPTVSFTAAVTGTYKIYGSFVIENNTAGQNTLIRIFGTNGAATVQFSQEAALGQNSSTANGASVSPYLLVMLNAGTLYSFTLQMRVSADTGSLRNDFFPSGQALIAEQLS